jgi:hypothetical protein
MCQTVPDPVTSFPATRENFSWYSSSPLSLSPKADNRTPAWPTQVADHLIPNRILGFFEFQGEREGEKLSVFKGLQSLLSAQTQGN